MKLIDLAHRRRRIVVYLKRLQVLIDAFKSRVSTDSGTFEGETNLKKQLQFIQNLFTSLVVLTPNAWKVSKLYTILQNDGTTDFDFVRATGATRVNESGLIESVGNNIPRIDWLNGKPQILIEEQRTNLLPRSEEFELWAGGSRITSNVAAAPDGNSTADRYSEASSGFVSQTASIQINLKYTLSVFAKAEGNGKFLAINILRDTASNTQRVWFDIENGTVGTAQNGAIGKIIDFGNGWYRCIVTGQNDGTSTSTSNRVFVVNADGLINPTVPVTALLWGAQMEQGENATSYIPTTTATVTRNADVATLDPPTGTAEIIETVDGVDNTITTIPTTYQLPEGRIDKILMK